MCVAVVIAICWKNIQWILLTHIHTHTTFAIIIYSFESVYIIFLVDFYPIHVYLLILPLYLRISFFIIYHGMICNRQQIISIHFISCYWIYIYCICIPMGIVRKQQFEMQNKVENCTNLCLKLNTKMWNEYNENVGRESLFQAHIYICIFIVYKRIGI